MKAEELRIGNLVFDKRNGVVCSVDGLQYSGRIVTEDKKYDDWKRVIDPEGIPLTEEWLIKFGFRPHPRGGFYTIIHNSPGIEAVIQWKQNGYLGIETAQGLDGELTNHTQLPVLIKHVHQLQNLIHALTGEELTIKE
jgi:hypothetical protein